jgi:hypothetical protein
LSISSRRRARDAPDFSLRQGTSLARPKVMLHSLTVSEAFPLRAAAGACNVEHPYRGGNYASLRLLVTGDAAALASVLPILDRHCMRPIHLYDAAMIPLVPSFSRGTVLLSEVDRLGAADQDRLFDWLTEHGAGHPSIVATSKAPLWPLVERGVFRADLFYRLNLVSAAAQPAACIDAIALAAAAGDAIEAVRRGEASDSPQR